jgi:phospholipid/cholesterol/gamma-HCH transport system substrate-binding protein
MKPDEKKIEKKVGVFVLIGLSLALIALLVLGGKQSFFVSVNHYTSHFNKVDGLVSGAKITLGGLQIGTVNQVELDPQSRDIKVSYSIERKYAEWIRKDSSIEIVTQGVLGDKYLSLVAGELTQPKVEDGGEIPQGASKDFSMLVNSSEKLMEKLTSTADNFERILTTFNKGNRADQIFQGLATTSKNMGEITTKLNTEVNQMKFKSAVNHLDSILEKVDHGQGTLGAFINDPALYDDAKALVGQVNRNRIVRNLIRQTIKDNKDKAVKDNQDKE